MIKLVFLMRRKPGMSRAAFTDYWLNGHTQLILRHAETLKIRRYVQSHAIAPDAAAAFRPEWDDPEGWDGIAEVWLDSLEVLKESRESVEMQALQALIVDDEASFVDLARSQMIVTQEYELIA